MSDNQHSPGIEWVMFRLGSGERPVSPGWDEGRHCLVPAEWRSPGDYEGKHRIDDARVGSVVVVPFHDAPAKLVQLTRTAVSA
ncbi:hypothetical protein M2272_005909 [Mycobacterium frederiksbergense]|uniref:Uncharacterized protein n=1 Tax=Mycolicibacterium frederiksbergense TaxID=117567 RepID=A0ABT6L8G0_9MYCO|nr:hypothetical protein [Mycolicibacterium frederiksbergense]MDH6199241.1 hypothetical protein [Mycolicibacterium frederiksbergense]